jgi:hypothetical protein
MHTPFFPALRPRLAPLGQRVQRLRQHRLGHLEQLLGPFFPAWLLAQADERTNSRQRIYSVRRLFWAFLYQVLNPHCPCREVVRQIQAFFDLHNLGPIGQGTGGYCTARDRFPRDRLPRIRHAVAAHAQKVLPLAQQHWHGWNPKVIDGTTIKLPDTAPNQRAYPQSRSQRPGCGFPLMKLVGLFSLTSGALLDYTSGNKHHAEQALLHKLFCRLVPRDLVLADRGFCSYVLLALLGRRQVAGLLRLHAAKPADLRQGKRLGKRDRLFTWRKPLGKSRYLSRTLWQRLAKELTVRVVRFQFHVPGYRAESVTLVTTLLDPKLYPAHDLARLYARRWQIELWFRDLKTTLGMEELRCQSPKMLHKELEMFLIAYNLIRALGAEASAGYEVPLDRISFKGTVAATRQYSIVMAQARSQKKRRALLADLLRVIALDQVPHRPGRREPRAVKRRPKPYALLNKPRHQFKDIPHRSHYRKHNRRKIRG